MLLLSVLQSGNWGSEKMSDLSTCPQEDGTWLLGFIILSFNRSIFHFQKKAGIIRIWLMKAYELSQDHQTYVVRI
jgi:hypothetical protein